MLCPALRRESRAGLFLCMPARKQTDRQTSPCTEAHTSCGTEIPPGRSCSIRTLPPATKRHKKGDAEELRHHMKKTR